MKRDPLVEIEHGIRGDSAAALGQAGRRLANSIGALRAYDSCVRRQDGGRDLLLDAAADALWCYVVQREAVGVIDHAAVVRTYSVSVEVWNRMGVVRAA